MILYVNDKIRLEPTVPKHAGLLFDAVDRNREHLSQYLSWVDSMKTIHDAAYYARACAQLRRENKEFSFVIFNGDYLIGRIGLYQIDERSESASIGYWLIHDVQGRGIMTAACKTIISFAFAELGLHRIEIRCAATNTRSQAIPERLGFRKEGVLKEADRVNGQYLDLYLYGILRDEWKQQSDSGFLEGPLALFTK